MSSYNQTQKVWGGKDKFLKSHFKDFWMGGLTDLCFEMSFILSTHFQRISIAKFLLSEKQVLQKNS